MIQALTRPINFPHLYPDSDGKPMADNTLQYRWIVRLVTNLKRDKFFWNAAYNNYRS